MRSLFEADSDEEPSVRKHLAISPVETEVLRTDSPRIHGDHLNQAYQSKRSQSKIRILVGVVNPQRAGGIFATEHPFLDELRRREGVSIATFPYGGLSGYEPKLQKTFRLISDLFRFASAFLRERPDIVHLNSAFDHRALIRDTGYALVASVLRAKLFVKYHGSNAGLARNRSGLRRMMTDFVFRSSFRIGVLSSEERANFLQAGHSEEKVIVVKNAVNVERFAAPREEPLGAARLLFIGRFIPSKGLLEVIKAMRIVCDRGFSATLTCIGDGMEMQSAKNLVESLNLSDVVTFGGYVPEPDTTPYYLSATMLVMPTRSEGFSMTIFQAVASGLPVLTTRIRAAADYLAEPDNCLWIAPGSEEKLAGRIIEVIGNPKLRAQMSENNRRLARAFSPEHVVDEYLAVYNQVLSCK